MLNEKWIYDALLPFPLPSPNKKAARIFLSFALQKNTRRQIVFPFHLFAPLLSRSTSIECCAGPFLPLNWIKICSRWILFIVRRKEINYTALRHEMRWRLLNIDIENYAAFILLFHLQSQRETFTRKLFFFSFFRPIQSRGMSIDMRQSKK